MFIKLLKNFLTLIRLHNNFNYKIFWPIFIAGSLIKSFYLNFVYFGFKDAFCFPILASYKTVIRSACGIVETKDKSFGSILIGFSTVPHYSLKEQSIWNVKGKIIFNGKATFGAGTRIAVGESGTMIIGTNFYVTAQTTFSCFGKIDIGNNTLFSWDILLLDTDAHEVISVNNKKRKQDEIIIGDNVWVGCRATILKGSLIPPGCIIGSSSLVNNQFTIENCIIAGVPAKIVKKDIIWNR